MSLGLEKFEGNLVRTPIYKITIKNMHEIQGKRIESECFYMCTDIEQFFREYAYLLTDMVSVSIRRIKK